jgi:hypothetical protein
MAKKMSQKWIIVLSVAGALLLISLVFFKSTFLRLSPFISPNSFCTVNDGAYQALKNNYANWTEYFKLTYPLNSREALVRDENTQQEHLVRSYYDNEAGKNENPILFMPTLFPPNDIYGAEGYVYAPNNRVPNFSRYEFSKLTEKFYCYHIK